MHREFYNRRKELAELTKKYKNLSFGELLVLYGRRRLGKTEFIKKFLAEIKTNNVYFFVNKSSKKEQLSNLTEEIYSQTNQRYIFNEWDDFFNYLDKKSRKEKFVFVMDEFSRIKDSSPEFITKFQNAWDSRLKNNKLMFIAIGSSMSMMYDIFMEKTAPLYGRVTYNYYFKPFNYLNFREMFSNLSEEKKIELYSIFGGTPHFLWYVKQIENEDLIEIISTLTLENTSVLREEPINFITMELKNETNYNAILHAISSTNSSRKEVLDKTQINPKSIDYYLNNLIHLLSIIKEEKNIFSKKETRYKFTDNFFKFWYKYIFPNQTLIELNNKKLLIERINKDINKYIGLSFEEIIKELFILYNGSSIKDLEINFNEMSSWISKEEEIDIVLNNTFDKRMILCEVKWKNQKTSRTVIDNLIRKSRLINKTSKIEFLIVSKSGFEENCIKYMKEKEINYLALNDISKLFDEKLIL